MMPLPRVHPAPAAGLALTLLLLIAALLAPTAARAQGGRYEIDPMHTFVMFEVDHFNTSTLRARFDKKSGSVQFDRAARSGSLDITLDPASVNSGTPAFDNHLRDGAFFNVATYPSASYKADRFVFDGDKVSAIEGELTLLGKTLPLTLTARRFNCFVNPMLRREVCGGDFEALMVRSRWGIDFGLAMGMADAVRLVIQAEAIRQP